VSTRLRGAPSARPFKWGGQDAARANGFEQAGPNEARPMASGHGLRRHGALLAVLCTAFAAVGVKLMDVQVVSAAKYAAYDTAQLNHLVSVPASRGEIFDRDGNLLAVSIPQSTVYADPLLVKDPELEAAELAPILGISENLLQADLSERAGFVYLAREIPNRVAAKVRALGLPGIGFLQEPKRFYPNGALAEPVLGVVGVDGTGLAGLEKEYERLLMGTPGEMFEELAPSGSRIPGSSQLVRPAHPGTGLVISLDLSIQYEAEAALAQEIESSGAKSGMAVVLDSHTGDVLAMANLQASSKPGSPPVEASYNLATDQVFEPGSVMKITTFAGALNEGLITPSTPITVPPGLPVGGYTFQDAEPHGTEVLSATQVLAQSSNIGTIEIAQRLGAAKVDSYMRSFGFGEPTGLDFPGSSSGILIPLQDWNGSTIGSDPIGQDAAVSAVQIADAYNVIANDGVFVPPRFLEATVSADGRHHPVPPAPPHRVIPQTVAAELRSMLEQVVIDGTGTEAVVPGYPVAGKTGTAQIPNPNGPGYLPGDYMATFVGFVPAQNPALTIEVSLESPRTSIYGGSVAAPVFAQIARYSLQLLGIPPPAGSPSTTSATPASPPTTVPLSSDVTGG